MCDHQPGPSVGAALALRARTLAESSPRAERGWEWGLLSECYRYIVDVSKKKEVFLDCLITTKSTGSTKMHEHQEHRHGAEGWEPGEEDWGRGRGRGRARGRGPGGPGRRGGPWGPGGFGPMGFGFGPWGPEGRMHRGPRVRRGDVRAAALALLAEEPRNGYQLIQEIAERSGG